MYPLLWIIFTYLVHLEDNRPPEIFVVCEYKATRDRPSKIQYKILHTGLVRTNPNEPQSNLKIQILFVDQSPCPERIVRWKSIFSACQPTSFSRKALRAIPPWIPWQVNSVASTNLWVGQILIVNKWKLPSFCWCWSIRPMFRIFQYTIRLVWKSHTPERLSVLDNSYQGI